MHRLTANKEVKEMSMVELAHNSCYTEDHSARFRDYDMDIDAGKFARELFKFYCDEDLAGVCDEDFDDLIAEYMQWEGELEGLIALFYRNLWAMADLHEYLKDYEDLEEQGLLMRLPCPVGSIIYRINTGALEPVAVMRVIGVAVRNESELVLQTRDISDGGEHLYRNSSIGKTVFLTEAEAEAALKKLAG